MRDARPSATAQRVAMRRAAHQLLDSPRVLDDPVALPILGPEVAAQLEAERGKSDGYAARFLRAFMVARSRYAEDELARAIVRGASQYVILGAGLDTFAYRNPFASLRVFEVDHPATQGVKRARLANARIDVPGTVTFVPIDFSQTRLADALDRSRFVKTAPAFFSWLGVVPYLELPAIRDTFRFVGSMPKGSAIVFDYGSRPESLSLVGRLVFRRLADRVAAAGEPWKTFLDPAELSKMLQAVSYTHLTLPTN